MFDIFTKIADLSVGAIGVSTSTRFGEALHFFIEDSLKIFTLIYVMLFIVSLFRAQLSPEKVKEYLSGKTRLLGYLLAIILGVVTPFCSCSSIPLFISFIAAGIPFGITMAFLISSPLISEVAAVLLFTMPEAGPKAAFAYITIGAIISIFGGFLCDKLNLEKFAIRKSEKIQEKEHHHDHGECCNSEKNKLQSTVGYAHSYASETVKEIWPYVLIGLGVGALMHGYVPQEFFVKYLGEDNIFAVVIAAVAGIPIYANHNSVLPIIQVLLIKGVPLGTSLVMLMSITAISLPELIMLHKVLSWKMLALFVSYLFISFIIVGYLLNWIM